MTSNNNFESENLFGINDISLTSFSQKPNITNPSKEGWLDKRSTFWKTYRKRWVVLQGQQLYTFAQEKIYEDATEIFDLRIFTEVKPSIDGNTGQFELLSETDTRVFCASSENEMKDWIKHIRLSLSINTMNKYGPKKVGKNAVKTQNSKTVRKKKDKYARKPLKRSKSFKKKSGDEPCPHSSSSVTSKTKPKSMKTKSKLLKTKSKSLKTKSKSLKTKPKSLKNKPKSMKNKPKSLKNKPKWQPTIKSQAQSDEKKEKEVDMEGNFNLEHMKEEVLNMREKSFKSYFYSVIANAKMADKYYKSFVENAFNDLEIMIEFARVEDKNESLEMLCNDCKMNKMHARQLLRRLSQLSLSNSEFEKWFTTQNMSKYYEMMLNAGVVTFGMFEKTFICCTDFVEYLGVKENETEGIFIWRNVPLKRNKNQKKNIKRKKIVSDTIESLIDTNTNGSDEGFEGTEGN